MQSSNGSISSGSRSLNVCWLATMEPPNDFQDIVELVGIVHAKSLDYLKNCIEVMTFEDWSPLVDHWGQCFFGGPISRQDGHFKRTMIKILSKTYKGLCQDRLIINIDSKTSDAGYVAYQKNPLAVHGNLLEQKSFVHDNAGKIGVKWPTYDARESDGQQFTYVDTVDHKMKGQITINADKFRPEFKDDGQYLYWSCVTLIHEASHKFALTSDVYYFDYITGGFNRQNSLIKLDSSGKFCCHAPENAGIDIKLLGNADSYGHFACRVGNLSYQSPLLKSIGEPDTSKEG